MARSVYIPSGLTGLPPEARGDGLRTTALITEAAATGEGVDAPPSILATTLIGGDGDDVLVASQPFVTETLFGNDGNDTLFGQARDQLFGGSGNDLLHGGWESGAKLYGGAGDDIIEVIGDLLSGTLSVPGVRVEGGEGNDTILNWNGGVAAYGGAGDDRFEVLGDSGGWPAVSDGYELTFEGGDGNDVVRILDPRQDIDWHGGAYLYGGSGNDDIEVASIAGDNAWGGAGDDRIVVREGGLDGGDGNDQLFGGDGMNYLSGGAGVDSLYGGGGQDRLMGGPGGDLLYGGAGADIFMADNSTDRTGRADRVMDFDFAAGDRINLTQLLGNMSGVDLIGQGFVQATAVTIDGRELRRHPGRPGRRGGQGRVPPGAAGPHRRSAGAERPAVLDLQLATAARLTGRRAGREPLHAGGRVTRRSVRFSRPPPSGVSASSRLLPASRRSMP